MIDIKNLTKAFGSHIVVNNVTACIPENQVVAILGPSGSGKSTLLRCMNLLETPTHGHIFIDGSDLTERGFDANKMRQNIGMVFQHFYLFPHMTVLQNITYAPMHALKISSAEAHERAHSLLQKVDLADKASAYPAHLSGGQKQRVAIARALAMEPKIMLFDEPTSALDPEMVKEVLDVIKDLIHTNMTIVLVTHEMGFAREVADHIWCLDQGKLLEQTPPSTFFVSPQSERARQFLDKVL